MKSLNAGLYGRLRLVDNVIHGQLYDPISDLLGCLSIIQYLTQRRQSVTFNLVCLKIMGKLAGCD
jgi:hypothetical protein